MGLDPITIAAQVINFLILVWLLNRFLFTPVTRVMDERAARVQAELDEAQKARTDAEQRETELQRKLDDLETQREHVLAAARVEAEALRTTLVAEAREQVERMRQHWSAGVLRERDGFIERLQERVLDHTQRAMRRALDDLADEDLERRMVAGFIERLGSSAVENLPAVDAGAGQFVVASSFDLPDDLREPLTAAVHARWPDASLRFTRDEHLACGVELRGIGRKLAWSVDDYLGTLRASVQELFAQLSRSQHG